MPNAVLVISSRARLREEVALRLADEPGIARVETAADGKTALDKLRSLQPDVIIADEEQAFVARRAMAILAGQGRAVKLILLGAEGKQMVQRMVCAPEPATWNRLKAAIAGTPRPPAPRRRSQSAGANLQG